MCLAATLSVSTCMRLVPHRTVLLKMKLQRLTQGVEFNKLRVLRIVHKDVLEFFYLLRHMIIALTPLLLLQQPNRAEDPCCCFLPSSFFILAYTSFCRDDNKSKRT